MPYRKLSYRHDRLRNSRLLLDLARVFNESIYGDRPLGASLDGVFIAACIAIGHAENRLMNTSKLAHYLGMSRQTVSRRVDELIKLGVIERAGTYFYISPQRYEQTRLLLRANSLVASACRDLERFS